MTYTAAGVRYYADKLAMGEPVSLERLSDLLNEYAKLLETFTAPALKAYAIPVHGWNGDVVYTGPNPVTAPAVLYKGESTVKYIGDIGVYLPLDEHATRPLVGQRVHIVITEVAS